METDYCYLERLETEFSNIELPVSQQVLGFCLLAEGVEQVRGLVEVQGAGGDWSPRMVNPCRLHL